MSAVAQASGVVCQGHLRKLKTMKKKYFVLRAENRDSTARLEYYETEKKYRAGQAPRRVLPLKSCYNITRRLDLKQKHVIALFKREEQFCIVADNEQELHMWLTALLKHHRNDDASEELLHPIQHVWQVNIQKKGLGATKTIQGLYNLCLTDKTLTLVKIKSQNNVISDLGIPERVEYSLKNIRRCGDSECFFYMEVGRQTSTGAGELWMLSEDTNIAQSMHSTIYHAMRNCAKETENERDHIKHSADSNPLPARRQTYSDGRGRAGLSNAGACYAGGCVKQCVCGARPDNDEPPEHDASTIRNRCDSMPSRACSSYETERTPQRLADLIADLDNARDEADSADWLRTHRIPEEPDLCDHLVSSYRGSSVQHSRTSSTTVEDVPDGYLPMAPLDSLGGLISASSGSVCSGTPSTDPRFSEYQLEPATSHIVDTERPPRAYSVGSRPARGAGSPGSAPAARLRAYSVGARHRPAAARAPAALSAPHLPRAASGDLMELDFSNNGPHPATVVVAGTPPRAGFLARAADEYVDMSPRNAGYVEMRPGDALSRSPPGTVPPPLAAAGAVSPAAPDGYVEMNYGRAATKPIPITASPEARRISDALFPLSLDSPASPDTHPLSTVREISEEAGRRSPEVSCSPSYVQLAAPDERAPAAGGVTYAALELQGARGGAGAGAAGAAGPAPGAVGAPAPARAYSRIDFARSQNLAAGRNS